MNTKLLFVGLLALVFVLAGCIGGKETPPPTSSPIVKSVNEVCLGCHSSLTAQTTADPNVKAYHKLHLDRGFVCTKCHEGWVKATSDTPKSQVRGGYAHPPNDYSNYNERTTVDAGLDEALLGEGGTADAWKPALKRLVCIDCHAKGGSAKQLYGVAP